MSSEDLRPLPKNREMMVWAVMVCVFFILVAGRIGCTPKMPQTQGVYMLLDTSGTYTTELKKASAIINYLLGTLQPGDTLAVGRIDTASFSEKDIVAKVTFDQRLSLSNNQKRAFKQKIDKFISEVKSSKYTDISGGILQAIEYLNEIRSAKKYILIFSDLKEELASGYIRDVPFRLAGFDVIALNVTKLNEDNLNPEVYMERVAYWQNKTEDGEGAFRLINDLERLEAVFSR